MSERFKKLAMTRRGMLGASATGAVLAGTGLGGARMSATPAKAAEAALADLQLLLAATARPRGMEKPVTDATGGAAQILQSGLASGVLFGAENHGLPSELVGLADTIMTYPVNPAFASLNLAQCVLLTAYEWGRQGAEQAAEMVELAGTEWASGVEVEKLMETLERRLEASHFFWPETKAEAMKLSLRNLLSRMPLTQADVRTFHGIIKFLADRHPKG